MVFASVLWLLLFNSTAVMAEAVDGSIESPDVFSATIQTLIDKSYKKKEQAILNLSQIKDVRLKLIFSEMLAGRLYYTKMDKKVVFIKQVEDGYQITDVIEQKVLSVVNKRKLKKIKVNNKLRKMLRSEIARLDLKNEKVDIRLNAAKEMMRNLDATAIDLFKESLLSERDADVQEVLATGMAIASIENINKEKERLSAILVLKDSLIPESKQALEKLIELDEAGKYIEKSYKVRKAAKSALKTINSKIEVNNFAETIFFGISLGSVLLLSAIGLAITFGVMGVINMAHGEMMMLGAYTTYLIQLALPDYIEYSLFMAIPAAFIVSGMFGVAIERGVIRFLYGRPLETLLATFGISLILQQLVRTTISAQNVAVITPEWLSGSLQINPVLSITYNRLYIIIFSLIVFVALLYVLKKTILGLQVRAVSQNRAMAKAMGVRSDWVDALTFGLGSGIAGIAGVALSQLTNVGPNLGQAYIIDSFMVVVFGGVGNLWGTFVGAMSLGVVNKFLEPWAGAVLAKIMVLVFIILFIQKRPRGLFPRKGRDMES